MVRKCDLVESRSATGRPLRCWATRDGFADYPVSITVPHERIRRVVAHDQADPSRARPRLNSSSAPARWPAGGVPPPQCAADLPAAQSTARQRVRNCWHVGWAGAKAAAAAWFTAAKSASRKTPIRSRSRRGPAGARTSGPGSRNVLMLRCCRLDVHPDTGDGVAAMHASRRSSGSVEKLEQMKIVVLGGDGFCGWPTALHLSDLAHDVLIADNLSRRRIDAELGTGSLTPIHPIEERVEVWQSVAGRTLALRRHRRLPLRRPGRPAARGAAGRRRALRRAARRAVLDEVAGAQELHRPEQRQRHPQPAEPPSSRPARDPPRPSRHHGSVRLRPRRAGAAAGRATSTCASTRRTGASHRQRRPTRPARAPSTT